LKRTKKGVQGSAYYLEIMVVEPEERWLIMVWWCRRVLLSRRRVFAGVLASTRLWFCPGPSRKKKSPEINNIPRLILGALFYFDFFRSQEINLKFEIVEQLFHPSFHPVTLVGDPNACWNISVASVLCFLMRTMDVYLSARSYSCSLSHNRSIYYALLLSLAIMCESANQASYFTYSVCWYYSLTVIF